MIPAYFAQIKATIDRYAATPFVVDATVTFDARPGDQGYFTGSIVFENFSVLHFKEFVDAAHNTIEKLTYSYHYQSSEASLIFRYDNARHKPALLFREHKHELQGAVIKSPAPQLEDVLTEVFLFEEWL